MTIRRISPADRGTLAEVLAKAFEHDPVLRWIIPANEHYQRIAIPYFSLLLHQSMSFGASYTNEDQTGVALWVGPSESPSAFSHLAGTCRLLWLLKGNILRAYRLQELMASYRPRKDFLHLTHIATLPEQQRSGIGAGLIEPMLEKAKALALPVYLECSNQDNLGFYRQFGFRLIDNISFKDGPTIWPMTLD
ncbi:MAG: GNAT superfamily N-acetyltransferase [Candidatus Azotimanducaceae bacterium]|jgi:GNAT superfamily N-acetyltransferase